MASEGSLNKPDLCQNCGTKLAPNDHYCASCGQKVLPEQLTLRFFIREFLSNYFSFDSKFFNTVVQLVVKPAYLSMEFIEGRRIRYINPIQLFVFSSFLFFLVNSFMFLNETTVDKDIVSIHDANKNIINDSINIQQLDSLFVIEEEGKVDTVDYTLPGELLKKGNEFNALDKNDQNEIISRSISYAVFLLMPIFAFYLGFLFKRKNKHYLENIIFSLHFHAFYYVSGVFFQLFDRLFPGDLDTLLLNMVSWIYLLIGVKKFYDFPWFSTVLRLVVLTILYGLTVAIILLCSILISVLL